MEQTFFIPGPLPSMNEIILASSTVLKGGIRFGSKYSVMKKKWQEIISDIAIVEKIKPVENTYTCMFDWIEKTRRKDPDNIAVGVKFIFDALVEAKIFKGDNWKYNKGWGNSFNVGEHPGVNVTITSYK